MLELEVAKDAAICAGQAIQRLAAGSVRTQHKGAHFDLVTEADLKAEAVITEKIRQTFPQHDILSEQAGHERMGSEFLWIVDPLDATTSFKHGYPYYCVSIALEHAGEPLVGVVYNPVLNELFHACKSSGAYLNNQPIVPSTVNRLSDAIFATGFAHERGPRMKRTLRFIEKLLTEVQDLRRGGSAALDLCHVACGRLDFYFEQGLGPYDIAAGSLVIEEARGMVTDYTGEEVSSRKPSPILATNGLLHQLVLKRMGESDIATSSGD